MGVPRLRRVAMRNLELAGYAAEERRAIADEVFASIGRLLVALARFPDITAETVGSWIRYEGLENYTRAKARGKGVLVATAHFGNWELSAFAHALMTEPMNVIVRPLDNRRIDALVERRRALSGNRLIEKKDAARAILRALGDGEAVGILIDQNSSAAEGVFVDFFGMKACANAAFVRIAARTGAAVVPGFAVWSGSEEKYVLKFLPEIPMTGDAREDTQRLQAALEEAIRSAPGQWLWIHRRWKTRPAGEPALY